MVTFQGNPVTLLEPEIKEGDKAPDFMLLAGIHPKIANEMLGHSSVAFTLDAYSHIIKGLGQAAVKRLDEVLLPELAQTRNVSNGP